LRAATKIVVLVTAALGALGLVALYTSAPIVSEVEANAVLAFAVLSVFGALMPYSLSERVSASATFVTFLASVVLVPAWPTVAAAGVVILLAQLVHRRGATKALFNVAQHVLALCASVVVFRICGGHSAVSGGTVAPFPLVVAFLAFFVTNTGLVAAVISTETRTGFFALWRENTHRGFGLDLIVIPFVYVFVKVYVEFGTLATSASAALIFVVRQLNSTNEELHRSNKELLELTVTTLEARDPYTSGHSRRVSQYSRMMGQSLSLSARQVDRLTIAALLHDVGKIHEVFAPILAKPGKLTPEERAIMESHPIKGAELVRISSHLRDAVDPIRHHHEAWDGSGYPDALAREAIPIFSRIIAIADTIDAMASDRPYRRGMSAEKIKAEIVRMSGIQFDPQMLTLLLSCGTIDTVLRLACAPHDEDFAAEPTLALVASR
jgi:HD domain